MQVELLFWDGCPSHPQALDELRAAMTELGLDPEQVLVREVDTEPSSPTASASSARPRSASTASTSRTPGEEPPGLTCRVYHRRDGRVSPVPDPADVRDALRQRDHGGPDEDDHPMSIRHQ